MKKTTKKKQYFKCVRCGSVGILMLDMGKMGKIWLCPVCWVGLAGCMARDFEVYKDFNSDYLQEMNKATVREKWFKENNLSNKKSISKKE